MPMDNYVLRVEYNEHNKRMEDEHNRQNARIKDLEDTVKEIGELTTAVKEMAISMHSMLDEQKLQGQRLDALENMDGEKWRSVSKDIVKIVVSAVIGYFLAQVGLQ